MAAGGTRCWSGVDVCCSGQRPTGLSSTEELIGRNAAPARGFGSRHLRRSQTGGRRGGTADGSPFRLTDVPVWRTEERTLRNRRRSFVGWGDIRDFVPSSCCRRTEPQNNGLEQSPAAL
jgi:hypothetical protein